jgi:L-rhamnose-H+ transport protein
MNILIGLLIIAIGSVGQASSYVPIKKVKEWSWESFWLVQGTFAWLVFPIIGALFAVPAGLTLVEVLSAGGSDAGKAIGFGILWGVGGLTFGLSMRYLGVALGQSLALGTCAAFGTLLPALFAGRDLFHGEGLTLLIGVCITIAGIAVIGYAGSLKSKNMSDEEKRKAVADFALKKGLIIAIFAGVMSACFSLGLEAAVATKKFLLGFALQGQEGIDIANTVNSFLKNEAVAPELKAILDNNALMAGIPGILLVTLGGFITNASYCIQQNIRNKTFKDYGSVSGGMFINNLLFCALAGICWYSQFFGLEVGKTFLQSSPVLLAFSWCILMSLNVLFSNVWGILLKEWKGAGKTTIAVLIIGLLILIFSITYPELMK